MGQSKHEFFPRASSRPSTEQVCLGTLSQVLKGQASMINLTTEWESANVQFKIYTYILEKKIIRENWAQPLSE